MFDALIYAMMTASTPAQRAALIASAPYYITNAYFCDLLRSININDPKKFNYQLFRAFDTVPEVRAQYNSWLLYGQKGYRAEISTGMEELPLV